MTEEYEQVADHLGPLCRVDDCRVVTEQNDAGRWECARHGVQYYPEYEVTKDVDSGSQVGLEGFIDA